MVFPVKASKQNRRGDLDFVATFAGCSVGVARCLSTGTGRSLRETEPQRGVSERLPDLSIKELSIVLIKQEFQVVRMDSVEVGIVNVFRFAQDGGMDSSRAGSNLLGIKRGRFDNLE